MKFDRFTKIMLIIIALLLVSILFVIFPKTSKAAVSTPITKSSTVQIVPCIAMGYFCLYYPEQKAVFIYAPVESAFESQINWQLKGFFQMPTPGDEIKFNKTGI